MQKILVSSCLLGSPVRYDGKSKYCQHLLLRQWQRENRLIAVCPEVSGGLSIPRPAAEIQHPLGTGISVLTEYGEDVSAAFQEGAQNALELIRKHAIRIAILKDGSPSCGSRIIYDGSFRGRTLAGTGITTRLLWENGIQVFPESELEAAAAALGRLENEA